MTAGSFLTERDRAGGFLHELDARAKIIGSSGLTVMVVTTPASAMWAFALYAAVLVSSSGSAACPCGTC